MAKKPKVSLRPVVDEIAKLLQDLDDLDEPKNAKDKQRAQTLRTSLDAAARMLRSECSNSDVVYEFPN